MNFLKKIINALLSIFSSKNKKDLNSDCGICTDCGTSSSSKLATSGKQHSSWCFHSIEKNETKEAVRRALKDNGNGLVLLFVCKPGCAICKAAWEKSDTDALNEFLKSHKIVGLHVDDTVGHFMALTSTVQSYQNPDGTKPSGGNPFLALVQVKESSLETVKSFNMSQKDGDVEKFLGGSNASAVPVINDIGVVDWIESLL